MEKIRVKLTMKQENHFSYEGIGEYEENQIHYFEDDISVTIQRKDHKVEIRRESSAYRMVLTFDEKRPTVGSFELCEVPFQIDLQIETEVLEWNNHEINIDYLLKSNETEMGTFQFHLSYEVIE